MKKTIAVVAAHPDDEILGCGGSMARHAQKGDDIHVLILAEGLTSRRAKRNHLKQVKQLEDLKVQARAANSILGVQSIDFLGLPDNRLDSIDRLDIIKMVENFITKYSPQIIYTHHPGDLNIDHRVTQGATVTACRPQPNEQIATLLFFEVPSSTDWQVPNSAPYFMPNWYVDIGDTLHKKVEALALYSTEMREWPHARSLEAVEHLAGWRGASIGVEAAEAFFLGRQIEL